MKDFDGSLLAQLHSMRQEAPEFFYTSLRQDLNIQSLVDILKLTEAMDKVLWRNTPRKVNWRCSVEKKETIIKQL